MACHGTYMHAARRGIRLLPADDRRPCTMLPWNIQVDQSSVFTLASRLFVISFHQMFIILQLMLIWIWKNLSIYLSIKQFVLCLFSLMFWGRKLISEAFQSLRVTFRRQCFPEPVVKPKRFKMWSLPQSCFPMAIFFYFSASQSSQSGQPIFLFYTFTKWRVYAGEGEPRNVACGKNVKKKKRKKERLNSILCCCFFLNQAKWDSIQSR